MKCESGNRGFLCASKCPTGYYRSFLETCKPCDDPEWSRSLWVGLFLGVFFLFIPVLFIGLYFSQSDKTANQYMVYPRMLVDLGVVFYLVYKSLFRYWPRELIGWQRTDGIDGANGLHSDTVATQAEWFGDTAQDPARQRLVQADPTASSPTTRGPHRVYDSSELPGCREPAREATCPALARAARRRLAVASGRPR